eukprot:scaffold11684_cov122-Isochrysis_galbana.AAC.2
MVTGSPDLCCQCSDSTASTSAACHSGRKQLTTCVSPSTSMMELEAPGSACSAVRRAFVPCDPPSSACTSSDLRGVLKPAISRVRRRQRPGVRVGLVAGPESARRQT